MDTNILSEPLAAIPNSQVLGKLQHHQQEIATCSPVWHEMVFGCARLPESKKRRTIARYLQDVVAATLPILAYDAAAARWHGEERARMASSGRVPPHVDGQIIAVARTNHLILVTRNIDDYRYFQGVEVENWFVS
ncbi:type II toxin-antitoxin system VapC family toxin [Gloeobacter morelensis]|uniref:type II toxin-antitoxin system VapC family toxin n=1 Tax=Gloeobacter morelensis TaxID=2907343 RepID=UPI001E504457|nr:type II toxin-antitoxin system VapC family toxin [Gloeobacter morelensis]